MSITPVRFKEPYKLRAQDIELLVAREFDYRRNVIVPNVSWGMGLLYEADLAVLRKSNYAAEIEIKISASDIKADLKKQHQHDSNLFRELWFAVPEKLNDNPNIPERAGIISINWYQRNGSYVCERYRRPVANKLGVKWTQEQRIKLLELASMRTWALKAHLQHNRHKYMKEKELEGKDKQ